MVLFQGLGALAVFLVVWVVSREALRQTTFDPTSSTILATCTAALSVLGLFHGLGTGPSTFSFLVIPYTALGIAVVLVLLLLLLGHFPTARLKEAWERFLKKQKERS